MSKATMHRTYLLLAGFLCLSFLSSCDIIERLLGGTGGNEAPTVYLEADDETVETGTQVTVTAYASDEDGDTLSYTWYLEDILQDVTDASVVWTPSLSGTYTIEVVVSDGSDSATDSVDITVSDPRLPAPDGLTASTLAYTSTIKLSWSAVSSASGYRVYGSSSATGTYTAFADEVSVTSANIIDVPYGSTRYYKVAALDAGGVEGFQSAYVQGSTFKDGLVEFTDDGSGDWIQFYTNRSEDKNLFWWDDISNYTSTSNGEFTAEVKLLSGDTNTFGHGVMFDYENDSSYKLFLFNRSGYLYVGEWNGSSYSKITDPEGDGWVYNTSISTLAGATNILKGDYEQVSSPSGLMTTSYYLFINDSLVYTWSRPSMSNNILFCAEVAGDEVFPSVPVDVRYRFTAPTAYP
jgi:hypothetical protein